MTSQCLCGEIYHRVTKAQSEKIMIKKRKPKKVLILGSGALQIGQAGIINPEFSSGSQC